MNNELLLKNYVKHYTDYETLEKDERIFFIEYIKDTIVELESQGKNENDIIEFVKQWIFRITENYEMNKYYKLQVKKLKTIVKRYEFYQTLSAPAVQTESIASNEVPIFENEKVTLPNNTIKRFVFAYIDLHNEYCGKHKELIIKLSSILIGVKSETIERYSKSYNGEIEIKNIDNEKDKILFQKKEVFKEFIQKHNL